MALAYTTQADNESVTLPRGSYTGHVLVKHSDCTLDLNGYKLTMDGTYTTCLRATEERR